jgi:azurin
LKRPTDYYLDYTLRETMRQLEPWWREAVREGKPVAADNPAGVDYLLSSVTVPELQNLPRTEGVLEALLTRSGVADADRAVALAELAEAKNKPRAKLLLDLLDAHGDGEPAASARLAEPLAWLAGEELKPVRARIAKLKDGSRPDEVKSAAWAALALADGSFDDVWREASASPRAMSDLLAGIPLLLDPDFRALAYDRVRSILEQTPESWTKHQDRQGTPGRYIRIELPRRGTLTLAEVEVLSEGQNIARGGKASQSSTAHGGDPERAVDGRKDGSYGSGTQTHTRENERRPWWELDLGREQAIESVAIWNRTDGSLGDRLDEFTLTVLDGSRNEVFKKDNNPVPRPEARIEVGGSDPVVRTRRAAIEALVSMGQNRTGQTFAILAGLIRQGEDITGAARGLRMLPHHLWPKQDAEEVTGALLAWAKSVPPGERTSMDYIETVQVTGDLAGLLPEARASDVRAELNELRVAVFVIRTVREQMRYDTPRLVVEAGKPFEIIIENVDFMPHNLVVVKPGARSQIGAVTDKMLPDQLDSRGRAFVPDSPDVLAATKLLEPGMKETLQMTAPEREGDYEYVCTFPGHWMVMWGRLIVTRDVEAYLKDHPIAEAPVAATEHAHHFQGE